MKQTGSVRTNGNDVPTAMENRLGIVTDKTEMSSVISGTRNGTKADAIIELSIDILDKYENGSVLVDGA